MSPANIRKQLCQIGLTDEDKTLAMGQLSSKNSAFYFSAFSRISTYRTNIKVSNRIIDSIGLEGTSGKHPVQLPHARQCHVEQVTQELIQAGSERPQIARLHSLPGQPVPLLCHILCKEVLPYGEVELLVFRHCSFSCHWVSLKSLAPSSRHPRLRY